MRTISVWAFTAFFAGISLLGPGWHCAFGHHFHGPTACGHHEHRCGHGHHHVDPSAAGRSPVDSLQRTTPAGHEMAAMPDVDGHDCPLCKFFGLAQWAPPVVAADLVQLAGQQPLSIDSADERTCLGLYRSRAPPSCAALS